ncbi:MAG: hypothetical protein HQ477_12685 [Chloroflexi bacterium]|nr:hypothetical protein [Chloroflexota bacterium]
MVVALTSTPTPTAVPILVATPPPTSTPQPIPDDRFGVIALGDATYQITQLGVDWYIDYSPVSKPIPVGKHKISFIEVTPSKGLYSPKEIETWATNSPGAVWTIGGEVNVRTNDFILPVDYVGVFDYYYEQIKAVDPTAKISGPSILNWDFTCRGCGGYQSGQDWFTSFIDAYSVAHDGASPPADIWAIDAYPLDWITLPMTDWNIVANQIQGYRSYLSNSVPGHATTPIYVNEVASHWGFSGLEFIDGEISIPAGQSFTEDFLWDEMEQYLINLFDWLKDNGPSLNVERWFLYATHVDLPTTVRSSYAGIELFDGFHAGANLNRLGLLYRDYAMGVR